MIAFIWFLPQIKLCHMGLQVLNKLRWFPLFFKFFLGVKMALARHEGSTEGRNTFCRPMIASKVSQHSLQKVVSKRKSKPTKTN